MAIKIPKALSQGEETLAQQMRTQGIVFNREVKFHPDRKWRFDFTAGTLAIEVEGGSWTNGRHNRGKPFAEDCIKYAEAICLGWRVMRFTTEQVRKGIALQYIMRAL